MREPAIIETVHLFPELDRALIDLLRGLRPEEWQRPTVCSGWSVKDIAAHLLDGTLRKLSTHRDGYFGIVGPAGDHYEELVIFLNRLNAEWVAAARRLSPALLISLLETSGRELVTFLQSLDPKAPALFPVAWAGERESLTWFDTAREYTERWHHQQQIRLAVGQPLLLQRRWYHPVLDTFMRGLPHAYRHYRSDSELICVEITGDAGGRWYLLRADAGWRLLIEAERKAETHVRLPQEIAWRLFTRGLAAVEAKPRLTIRGATEDAEPLLAMLCVMA